MRQKDIIQWLKVSFEYDFVYHIYVKLKWIDFRAKVNCLHGTKQSDLQRHIFVNFGFSNISGNQPKRYRVKEFNSLGVDLIFFGLSKEGKNSTFGVS